MKSAYPVQSYISYSLAIAHRQIHTSLTRRLKQFGVQVEAWRIMEILEADTDLTMGDLAELALMNPPALTKLVDRMVADGLVHRRVASSDQRKVNLGLTEIGRKRIAQVREEAKLEEEEIAARIGMEDAGMLQRILSEIGKARH